MDKTRRWRFTAIALVTALMFVAVAGYALAFTTSEEDEILWHIRNTAHNFWRFWTEDSPGNFPWEVAAMKQVLDNIDAKLDGKPDIKHVTASAVGFGTGPSFTIRLVCTENFQVKALYALVQDPDGDIDIRYYTVGTRGDFVASGAEIIPIWWLPHVDFDPGGGLLSTNPYELLSSMQVDHPVAVAAPVDTGGSFNILGQVQSSSDSTDDTLYAGAVVETAQSATCTLTIY